MAELTLEKAERIAKDYYHLLIEKHKNEGYEYKIVLSGDEEKKNEGFLIRFEKEDAECKSYRVIL